MRFNPLAFPPLSSLPIPRPWDARVPGFAADCEIRARELLERGDLAEEDRERLEMILNTVTACYSADYLLFLPVDSWMLIIAASEDLMAIEAKYETA